MFVTQQQNTAMHSATAKSFGVRLSVCLSVCLSVTRRYLVITN